MTRHPLALGFAVALFALTVFPSAQSFCLHGPMETPGQAARRQATVRLADQINAAQAASMRDTGRFRPLAQIPNLPAPPPGFTLRFYIDGATDTLSLKDTQDRCAFAIFSDQDGELYEGTPSVRSGVVPLGS